jgi:hypothetical protein
MQPIVGPQVVQVSALQTMSGITKAEFLSNIRNELLFQQAVASSCGIDGLTSDNVDVTGVNDVSSRRRLIEELEIILEATSGGISIEYIIAFVAQIVGFTDAASAAAAVTTKLTQAVQSGSFGATLNTLAQSSGNDLLASVVVSKNITTFVQNPTASPTRVPSFSPTPNPTTQENALSDGAIAGIVIGNFLQILFEFYLNFI